MHSDSPPTGFNFTDPTRLPALLWLVEGHIPRLYANTEGATQAGIAS
jgi:hypothetical protein